MYLNETAEYKEELAMLIEEFLRQRIQGMPNEDGVFVTPAFPKLIYALEEDNIYENSKYWYLTKLAAECSAKRLVPDYISEKKMKELKEGNCFPSMGCVSGDEVITIKYKDNIYVESFKRVWNRFSNIFEIKEQEAKGNYYIDLVGVTIFDSTKNDFVECKRIIKNKDKNDWVRLKTSNGRLLTCTKDHPLAVVNKGRTFVEDIKIGDEIEGTWNTYQGNNKLDPEYAWSLGVIICDGNITNTQITCSFAATKEDDIIERLCNFYKSKNIIPRVKELSRGVKGNYKDVMFDVDLNSLDNRKSFIQYLTTGFEGKVKLDRKIPNEIFESDRESRLHFLGGIIDADGYIHDNGKTHFTQIEIGTTNKELALEQLLLINSLGYFGKIIENRYNKDKSEAIRYQVSFSCGEKNEILNYITCEKKKKCFRNHKSNKKYRGFKVSEIKELTTDGNKWSYDVTTESDRFDVSGIASHNCRSFLSPWKDESGNYKFYGRLNQGVVTVSLPDAGLSAEGDINKFWEILDERLELCHRALYIRHKRLVGVKSDVAPVLWQHGAFARLKPGEVIDKYLFDGYSTISLGYAGLYECVKSLTGESHTKHMDLAKQIMQKLNDACNKWKSEENIGYSVYGSPIESTTYKFAKCLKKRFGEISGITDESYITNSYHINVKEEINPFEKLRLEAELQPYSSGGMISYIECANLTSNIEAVLEIIRFIYDNISYAELNTKSDYCSNCGFDGEIKIIDKDGILGWKCPNCGCEDQHKLHVSRRTCGYIGSNFWNQGRTAEIKDRYVHVDDHEL